MQSSWFTVLSIQQVSPRALVLTSMGVEVGIRSQEVYPSPYLHRLREPVSGHILTMTNQAKVFTNTHARQCGTATELYLLPVLPHGIITDPCHSVGRAGLSGSSTHFHLEEKIVVFSYCIDPQTFPFRCLLPPFNSSLGARY